MVLQAKQPFRIRGHVRSQQGVSGLQIEAWDKDLIFNDLVGSAVTDEQGAFQIEFDESYFKELFLDRRPDLFFKVFRAGTLIKTTEDSVLWNVNAGDTEVVIEVDAPAKQSKAQSFVVQGQIRQADGSFFVSGTVCAVDKDLRTEQVLGEGITDKEGRYKITYTREQFRRAEKQTADLIVRVLDRKRNVLAESATLFNAEPIETVNLAVGRSEEPSEYERYLAELAPVLDKVAVADLSEEDLAFLAGDTKLPRERIAYLRQAARLAGQVELPPEVFYGLARQGVPIDDLRRLLSHRLPVLRQALEAALKARIVPSDFERQLDEIMDRLRSLAVQLALQPDPKSGPLSAAAMLGSSGLSRSAQEQFAAVAAEHEGSADGFWERLANATEFRDPAQIEEAKVTLQLGALTGYHLPMVQAIQAFLARAVEKDGHSLPLKDMAKLDETTWYNLVRVAGAPENVPGKNAEERARMYATALREQVEAAFPAAAIAAQISRSNLPLRAELSAFFASHPDFDLLADSVDQKVGSEIAEPLRQELKRVQRLARVAPRSQAFQVLLESGLHSAQQIAAMSEGAFVTRFGNALGGEQAARAIYESAAQRSGMVHHLRMSFGSEQNLHRPKMIPPPLWQVLQAPPTPETPPSWTVLFGSPDVCACEHGRSVLGPAAYLTDLLQFIRHETDGGLDVLLASDRRPDLQYILLNSQNAETPLPYIDLANEIFEQAVANGNNFIERQTTWTAAELAANPEHVDVSAYGPGSKLLKAIFPWSLPFDLEATEARVYLAHLGTSRHELMEVFHKDPESDPVNDEQIAREYLNLTETEWGLIGGSMTFALAEMWGLQGRSDQQVVTVLADPREVMARASITFDELQRLLFTQFINPDPKFHVDYSCACSLQNAKINFAVLPDARDIDFLVRFCRFVRLWRTLGWSIEELDAGLKIFGTSSTEGGGIPLQVFSLLQRLRSRLQLPVIELLSFYADLNKLSDLNQIPNPSQAPAPPRLFETVFFSRKVGRADDKGNTEFWSGIENLEPITRYLPQVTAALGVSAADVLLLLKSPVEQLSVASLSRLYRVARLCRATRLSVPEFDAMVGLTGIHPVWDGDEGVQEIPRRTLNFLTELEYVHRSGFRILELDGLLCGRPSAEAAEASLRENAVVLQQLRTSLQQIDTDFRAPGEDATLGDLETLLRQKLAVIVSADEVELVLSWANSDPGPDWIAKAEGLIEAHPEIKCLNLTTLFPDLPDQEVARADELRKRYADILGLLLPSLGNLLSRTLVKQQLSQALQVEPAVGEELLQEWVDAVCDPPGTPSIEAFVAPADEPGRQPTVVTEEEPPSLDQEKYSDLLEFTADENPFGVAFNTVARLRKVILVLSRLRITFAEASYLFSAQEKGWLNLARLPVKEIDGESLYAGWKRLVDVCKLHDRLGSKEPSLFDLFDLFASAAATEPTVPFSTALYELRKRTGWEEEDIRRLLDYFSYIAQDLSDERAFLRLETCFKLSQRLGVTIAQPWNMLQWASETLEPGVGGSIKRAARAKYADDGVWAAVARPLQNAVREQKRAALVAYLTGTWSWTPDHLYAHFLIDPEMSACMLTSRIKQAISSVQLFIQRIFLGLERVTFQDQDSAAAQWAWMKNYRVWEANRKVFLFPENWIEPALRDDKSPFFKELENELRQSETTPEYVEKVYLNYLQKLDEVSNLEMVGQCYGTIDKEATTEETLHVFGRTKVTPHVYYYRRRDTFGVWSAWEKINLDIEGDHVLPVVWNRRLWLFWPVFKELAEKAKGSPQKKQASDASSQEPKRYWTIRLASSQYSQSGWMPKTVSRETMTPVTQEFTYYSRKQLWGIPVYVHQKDEMPGLLALPFDNNSSLFSFLIKCSNKHLEIKTRYPVLESYEYLQETTLKLPGNSGLFTVPAGVALWALDYADDYDSIKAGTFVVKPSHVSIAGGLIGLVERYKVPFVELDIGDPRVLSRYPIQGMALYGFGNPSYDLAAPGQVIQRSLWQGEPSSPPEPFRIVPLIEEPDAASSLSNVEYLFVSDSQRTFHVERRNPQVLYHPFVTDFIEALHTGGIEGLLKPPPSSDFYADLYRQRGVRPIVSYDGGPLTFSDFLSVTQPLSYPGPVPGKWKPREDITFEDQEAYSLYNWELFFHVPLLIADQLSKNQQFEAAMRWFHYIFDPLDPNPNDEFEWQRPWRLGRFYDNGDATLSIQWLMTVLSRAAAESQPELPGWDQSPAAQIRKSLVDQIKHWRVDPFKPHLLARMRITPYMKTVVMKYLDNLMAWADQLFRRDTIESINEATQLYILAAEILGPRPQQLPERQHTDHTYADIKFVPPDDFSNVLEDEIPATRSFSIVNIGDKFVGMADVAALKPHIMTWLLGGPNAQAEETDTGGNTPPVVEAEAAILSDEARVAIAALSMEPGLRKGVRPPPAWPRSPRFTLQTAALYFCIPQNDTLLDYWETVADRLFKIRHCLNIEGVERELPLFEPPIEPGLLVRAAAAGVDFSTVLNDLSAPAPHYRFNVLAQKAAELCQEVKALGGALLAALEKRDAEGLALLRSEHEISMLEAVREVRKEQVQESQQALEGLNRARLVTEARYEYYQTISKVNEQERQYIDLTLAAMAAQVTGQLLELSASGAVHAPDWYEGDVVTSFGGPMLLTHDAGGSKAGQALQALARQAGMLAAMLSTQANLAATSASHNRRWDDWKLQERLAERELKQIDKQIAAAEIRVQIAEQELANHEQQIDNANVLDDYMRSKFTSQELYDWMVGQISAEYFQSYQLAYDTAKRAERAYRFELGLDDSKFIHFGYWDNLRKGLLAGEQLYHDLKRMEADYLERNRREYEITKHVSLALLDPMALLNLRQNGDCFVDLSEALFDLDCPGHYMRRIKSVSLSIPCVAGPYTSVNCTLTLLNSRVRKKGTVSGEYTYEFEDPNYSASEVALQSVVTSGAQNDGGLFELSFRDERYLPFEGAGAISSWRIELPSEFRQFDYNTISDVILHIRYTAREGGVELREQAIGKLKSSSGPYFPLASQNNAVLDQLVGTDPGLFRLFSAKHDFSSEWAGFVSGRTPVLGLKLTKGHFPYEFRAQKLTVSRVGLLLALRQVGNETTTVKVEVGGQGVDLRATDNDKLMAGTVSVDFAITEDPNLAQPLTFSIASGTSPAEIENLLFVLRYKAESIPDLS